MAWMNQGGQWAWVPQGDEPQRPPTAPPPGAPPPGTPEAPPAAATPGAGAGAPPPDPIDTALTDLRANLDPIQRELLTAEFAGLDKDTLQDVNNRAAALAGRSTATADALNTALTGAQGENARLSGALGGLGDRASALGGNAARELGDVRGRYETIAGADDPRFSAFAEGQRGLLDRQRGAALQATSEELARTGVRGTAAINDLNRVNEGFNTQERALLGDVGLQQMQRQDAALGNLGALTGQRTALESGLLAQEGQFRGAQGDLNAANANMALGGAQFGAQQIGQEALLDQSRLQNQALSAQLQNEATQSRLGARTTAAQNYTIDPALRISYLAAQNAGQGGGGGKK